MKTNSPNAGTLEIIRTTIFPKLREGKYFVQAIVLSSKLSLSTFYNAISADAELNNEYKAARAAGCNTLCERVSKSAPGAIELLKKVHARLGGKHAEDDITLDLAPDLQSFLMNKENSGEAKIKILCEYYLSNEITVRQYQHTATMLKLLHPEIAEKIQADFIQLGRVELIDNGKIKDKE